MDNENKKENALVVSGNYIKAVELNRKIITSAQLAQQSLYDMCMSFKEMRDSKLYKELGYKTFENYCEKETGFTRKQAYQYITVVENLPKDFVTSRSQNTGVTKLVMLAKLSEKDRSEIIEKTDLENTSVRELENQIKQIKAEKDKAIAAKSAAEADAANAIDKANLLEKMKESLSERIERLQDEIKELENRPIEVAVAEPKDGVIDKVALANLAKLHEEQVDRIQEQEMIDRCELMEKHEKELAQLRDELEQAKLEELENVRKEYERKLLQEPVVTADDKEIFKVYFATAIDTTNRLCDYVKRNLASPNKNLFTQKILQMTAAISQKVEEING